MCRRASSGRPISAASTQAVCSDVRWVRTEAPRYILDFDHASAFASAASTPARLTALALQKTAVGIGLISSGVHSPTPASPSWISCPLPHRATTTTPSTWIHLLQDLRRLRSRFEPRGHLQYGTKTALPRCNLLHLGRIPRTLRLIKIAMPGEYAASRAGGGRGTGIKPSPFHAAFRERLSLAHLVLALPWGL